MEKGVSEQDDSEREKEQEKVSSNIGNGFYYYMLSDGHINV